MSLEKIASKQSLSKEDIISAAREYAEFEKQAAAADAQGRELAHKYVEEMSKQKETEKVASDADVTSAIETLKKLGVIKG